MLAYVTIRRDLGMTNAEVRMTNRSRSTLTFEIQNSSFARLWFLAKNKNAAAKRGFGGRRKQTLFIDARKLGTLDCQPRPVRRLSKTIGAFRGRKTFAPPHTKGFSRFIASGTAKRPKFV